MSNWVRKYKEKVVASHKQHIIVTDRDNLLEYSELKQSFVNDGYKIVVCKTGLAVRLEFELQMRETSEKYLIVAPAGFYPLPDLEQVVNFKEIGFSDLFPNLDAKAISGLSFNALCLLSDTPIYEELGHEKTLKFLLENLYNVDFETITKHRAKERVLNALITVYLEKNGINESLIKYLSHFSAPYFPELVSAGLSKVNLIKFINDQWQTYVNKGDSLLDFNEPLLNKSLGYLLVLGYLHPVKVSPERYQGFPKALKIGVFVDEKGQIDNELEGFIEYLKQQFEIIEDIPDQWFKIVEIFSTAKLKYLKSENATLRDSYLKIENLFNDRFQRFIDIVYSSLFSLSGVRRPVVVTRILEHIKASPSKRKALLVIDGLNYWQWNIMADSLQSAKIDFTQGASFAFIPTITAWSRQAIFRGEKPDLLENNSKEAAFFQGFWSRHGILPYQIDFRKFDVDNPLDVNTISKDVNLLGLVCNDMDKGMHGSILGDDQLLITTVQWTKKSNIISLIEKLRAMGFQTFITSDHGNIEAMGLKNLSAKEKVGSISRGKRHLHFTNSVLMEGFLEENKELEVGIKGLSVYLRKRQAFTDENTKVVTHGGSHFWEVIVPFITINE